MKNKKQNKHIFLIPLCNGFYDTANIQKKKIETIFCDICRLDSTPNHIPPLRYKWITLRPSIRSWIILTLRTFRK
jgi:hypothetical protein